VHICCSLLIQSFATIGHFAEGQCQDENKAIDWPVDQCTSDWALISTLASSDPNLNGFSIARANLIAWSDGGRWPDDNGAFAMGFFVDDLTMPETLALELG